MTGANSTELLRRLQDAAAARDVDRPLSDRARLGLAETLDEVAVRLVDEAAAAGDGLDGSPFDRTV